MLILLALSSYFISSLSFAVIFSQWYELQDPREQGSHNPGATNMLRLGHPKLACLVLLGDALKAIIPLLIAKTQGVPSEALAWLLVLSIIGHMFPIFFHFKGGKGIATALGGLLILSWPIGLLAIGAWISVFVLFNYASLASLAAISTMFITTLLLGSLKIHTPIALLAGLLIARHGNNWARLWAGQESKIQISKYFHD